MAVKQTRLVKPVKKLRKLLSKLDRDPPPEQVHDLRTSARRVEAAFKALALDDAGIPKSVVKELRRLRKRAGKVRDMDVLTEFVASVHPKGEEECHVRLLEHLGAQRQRQAGKLYAELKRLRPGVRKELDDASLRMTRVLRRKSGGPADSVVTNAAARALKLCVQLAAPPRLDKTNLHPYRLKVKELQNVLLMADAPSRPRFVQDLGSVKDAIGEWHDWEELVGIASMLVDHRGNCLLLTEIKGIAERKYDHALSLSLKLRKTYLQSSAPKRKDLTNASVPRAPVWEAVARLAG